MDSTLPLSDIINSIAKNKNIQVNEVTCEDVKEIILSTQQATTEVENINPEEKTSLSIRNYNISFKEDIDNDLILFYYNEQHQNLGGQNLTKEKQVSNDVENACKSCVYTISGLQYICSQFNRIVYNDDAMKLIAPNLENTVVQKCYEGTTLLVFNHNNKWFISTRKCIDGGSSTWVKNQSYKDLFEETIGNDIYNVLNKDLCYVFILVHYKNKNIVNYNQPFNHQNKYYKKLYLSNVTTKGTYNELSRLEYSLPNIPWTEEVVFDSLESLLKSLEEISNYDSTNKSITTEGYIVKIYGNSNKNGKFTIGKLQTNIYQYVMSYKPNVQNIYQIYLEFYKQDKLTELLPYFYRGKSTIILKIHNSMKILTKEILELYHMTRNKRNEKMYETLPKIYKKVLYDLHGIYIKCKKITTDYKDDNNNVPYTNTKHVEEFTDDRNNKSINIHDVYNFLKSLPLKQLVKIFQERENLIEVGDIKCLNTTNMDIIIYTKLLLD